MSNIPETLRYSEDHEWVKVTGGVATVGITDHAQDQLGDIVYVGEFPDIGDSVEAGDVMGVIESVKASSDIFAPVAGKIVEVNPDLAESPELTNSDPYGEAWILKIKLEDPEQISELLTASAYEDLIEE
jgi:glycine cleavage system H protein